MNEAIAALHALAQALAVTTLYAPGHAAARRSQENLWHALGALLAVDPHPVFLFLGTAPVYAGRALQDLRDWPHSARLSAVGIQQLEFDATLTSESVATLVDQLTARLAGATPAGEPLPAIAGVAFGYVVVERAPDEAPADPDDGTIEAPADIVIDLIDELDAMQFVRAEAIRGAVARAEAEALVRILSALVDPRRLPQAASPAGGKRFDDLHPVNTSLLAMTAAARIGIGTAGRQDLGVVALLHNIGMALLPPGLADDDDRDDPGQQDVESHTVSGARLLLRHGGAGFELAATVAFEHHVQPDGRGYPSRRFSLVPHWASGLVGCCAAFVSLHAPRPGRDGWAVERAAASIAARAGTVFDPEIATLVTATVRGDR